MKKTLKTAILFSLMLLNNRFIAQEDKTVELTTTGTGKTKEIAIHTALRSAIEQAFGVFISSKTEVLNDELLTDQIISVSNGNIQRFDIISEMPIDDNTSFAVTVKSKVSISKLTSFIESKGIEVEFKGAVFAMNIKQQKLNEESELKAIKEMSAILKNIADRSFDFEVAAEGEPTLSNSNADNWNIPLTISVKLNKNFENYKSYFQKTLSAITMTEAEANNYINLKKPIYSVMLRNQTKTLDTLLVKAKVKYAYIIKHYLSDSMNYLEIDGRNRRFDNLVDRISQRQFKELTLELSQIPGYRNISEEKSMKLYTAKFDNSDTIRLKVISGLPLYNMFYLRNRKSSIEIQKLVFYFVHAMQNFILDDGDHKSNFETIYKLNQENDDTFWMDIFNISITKPAEFLDSPENLWCSALYGAKNDAYGEKNLSSLVSGVQIREIKPYNENNMSESDFPKYNYLQIQNVLPKFDLNNIMEKEKRFMHTGKLFHPIFPGLSTVQYNYNTIIQNSTYNIVLQFNQLCDKNNVVAKMKITDVKSLNELNKLNGYKIYPKR
jgi:hypothetical protein